MKNILSNTFTFQIQSVLVNRSIHENIIFISEEDSTKHFAQYIQYTQNADNSINLRHINIKLDRSYYLEIANSCIDNRERRRYFFSTLGKRRFGASNKHLDAYFTDESLDEKTLFSHYLDHYEGTEFSPIHVEKTAYSTNKYRVHIHKNNDTYIVFLDQLNITSRKKIHKIFCVDITINDLNLYNSIQHSQHKVNYLFNKIGKVYFKNLDETHVKNYAQYSTSEELALSMLIRNSDEMEKSSRINDNSTFRKLQESREDVGRVDSILHTSITDLINNPTQENNDTFLEALEAFSSHLEGINGLKEILEHLKSTQELSSSGTLSYLLLKGDQDLKDIILYVLESFSLWNAHLYSETENLKSFNIASIDFADALRYFIEVCYKFNHEYKCAETEEKELPSELESLEGISTEIEEVNHTSAATYFSEIEIDSEIYEELVELERDIEMFSYAQDYTADMNNNLINFFEGYTRVLNPLFEFKDLSYSLILLSQKLSDYEIDENSEMLLLLLKGLLVDLLTWKQSVLVDQDAQDIHFMDKSFYSNIAQIEMSLENNILDDDEGDMEFF